MKLINCPHCGKEVSTIANANTCPYCHNKLDSQFEQSQEDLLAERDSLQQQVDAKQAAAEQAARKAQEEQYSNDVSGTVYWVSGGECYHSTPDCATLKRSSNITSGSISQAGGRRPCKVCH